MAWYRNGTIAVTNGSPIVTGTGTSFVANVQPGHAINLPDGRAYEVASVNSDTQLTLGNPSGYLGATASGQAYSVQPNQGFAQTAATALATLLSQFTNYLTTALAGRFGDGTAAAPGISFSADQDTGIRRPADNTLALTTGGGDRLTATANGIAVAGALSATAGISGPTLTSGSGVSPLRIMGDGNNVNYGLGGGTLAAVTTGQNNLALGSGAFGALTTGGSNTALGNYSGASLTTGGNNVVVGHAAGNKIATGGNNTLVGVTAGSTLSGGDSYNTIVGGYQGVAGQGRIVWLGDGAGTARFFWDGNVNTITGPIAASAVNVVNGGAPAITVSSHNVYGGNESYAGVYSVATQDDINGPGWAIGVAGIANVGANNPTASTGRTWGVYGSAPGAGAGSVVQIGVMGHSKVGFAYAAFNANRDGYVFFVNGQSGHITPGNTDNVATIGSASNRYSTVFAGTNTINTSDKTLKTVRATKLTDQERAWVKSIEVVAYQFNDAIEAKGVDGARVHWGVLAQDVYQAGIDAGIVDPMHYAFLCRDPLTVHRQEIDTVPTRVPAMETVQEPQATIEMIDGRAVQRVVMTSVERQIIDRFPVFDEAGQPVTRVEQPFIAGRPAVAEVRNEAGEVVQAAAAAVPDVAEVRVPVLHDVPRMIDGTVEVARDITEPVLDEHGTQVMRWGVRYVELLMFLLACEPEA